MSAGNEQNMDRGGIDLAPLRVSKAAEIAAGIFSYELRRPDEGELPEFTPGAHLKVLAPNGLIRRYSLCGDPGERDRYVIAVKRDAAGRGGSLSLTDSLRAGDELRVSQPINNFPLDERAPSYIFIAGGIGITPILSMVRYLKSATSKSFKLFYCTRTPTATAFREELGVPELKGQVIIHHDEGDPGRALDLWPVLERPSAAHIYCCGPRALMEGVRDMTGHWRPSAVHFESFGESAAVAATNRPFRVKLARSGAVLDVPGDRSILEVLRAHGVAVSSSCESGSCGSCRTSLLGGEAEHRDFVLSDGEKGSQIMVCISRAVSDELVLDL